MNELFFYLRTRFALQNEDAAFRALSKAFPHSDLRSIATPRIIWKFRAAWGSWRGICGRCWAVPAVCCAGREVRCQRAA